jgi:glucuronide carrier protein
MKAGIAGAATAGTGSNEPERLGVSSYVGYAGGDFANNLTFSLTSLFLLVYYTDVAGIAAGAAGAVLVVARIWGAFTDVLAGRVVDRTHTRWGKFRPYFLFGGPPLMLITVALFTVPGGLSEGGTLAYAYVTYMLFYLVYSFLNIPFGSVAGVMSQLPDERAKLSSARTVGAALAIILLAFVVAPQLTRSGNLHRSLTVTTIVFAVVGVGLYLTLFATSREKVERDTGAVSLRQTFSTVRENRPLVLLCASALFVLTGMFTLQTLQVYYARDVLGNADYVIVLTVVSIGGMFITAPLLPRIVRAFGKKRAYVVCGVITVVGSVGIALSPPSIPVLAFISFAVYGVGLAVVQALMWTLEADTVEYGEWKSGARTEGSNYALLSFARKVGQGIGGGIAAWGIGFGGYAAGAATQSTRALDTIRWVTGGAPAVFVGIGAVIMLAYPLTEQRFQELVSEVALRRARRLGAVGEESRA